MVDEIRGGIWVNLTLETHIRIVGEFGGLVRRMEVKPSGILCWQLCAKCTAPVARLYGDRERILALPGSQTCLQLLWKACAVRWQHDSLADGAREPEAQGASRM